MIEIIAISEAHIESFRRALDIGARERRYLPFSRRLRWTHAQLRPRHAIEE
jgi:hypothetical protein